MIKYYDRENSLVYLYVNRFILTYLGISPNIALPYEIHTYVNTLYINLLYILRVQ